MLFLIGLGLGDAKDITVKGLEIIKEAERVYLEAYTSVLTVGKDALEEFYGRKLIVADRELVEQGADNILEDAEFKNIAFLVVGDPFGATTHADLILRAKQKGIPYKVIHNASIINAIACCGLQLYSFGEIVSIPFWTGDCQGESVYDKISGNITRGLHTLCLLDIRVKEPTLESIMKKKKEYEPPRFMTVCEAAAQLLQIVKRKRKEFPEIDLAYCEDTVCVGVARIGSDSQQLIAGTLLEMENADLGPPLHSLVICGELHYLEIQYLQQYTKTTSILKQCPNTTIVSK